jgi:amino acid transporter
MQGGCRVRHSCCRRAGSKHVWLARSLGLPASLLITFVYWATGPAGAGFLAYAFGTFLGNAMAPLSPALGHFLLSDTGHILTGLAAIWLTFWINAAGIKHYGVFVTILMFVICGVAALITIYGFATPPETFVAAASMVAKVQLAPAATASPASLFHFISVTALFVFAYAGLGAGPALGGETQQPEKKVPQGIMWGWLAALILFTAVAAALFHAAPWWASRRKVPLAALLLIAGLSSLFLLQSVFVGWAMGVAVRSLADLGMRLALAIGALNFHWHKDYGNTEWGNGVKNQPLIMPAAILSIVLAVPLIISLAVLPKTPLLFQPLFQGAVVLAVGAAILATASTRLRGRGESFRTIAAQLPIE